MIHILVAKQVSDVVIRDVLKYLLYSGCNSFTAHMDFMYTLILYCNKFVCSNNLCPRSCIFPAVRLYLKGTNSGQSQYKTLRNEIFIIYGFSIKKTYYYYLYINT